MDSNNLSEEKNARILKQLRSLSPPVQKRHSLYDETSDESFERLEKICEMFDDENYRDVLPNFSSSAEETKYILEMERYAKDRALFASTDHFEDDLVTNFQKDKHESSSSSYEDSFGSSSALPAGPHDTLEEIDLLLTIGDKMKNKAILPISTPQFPKHHFQNVRNVQTERKLLPIMPFVNYKRGSQFVSPTAKDSFYRPANCGNQLKRPNSPIPRPFRK